MTKQFTVSTFIFDSLKEAKEQINEWNEDGDLRRGTRVFEIKAVYVPKFTLTKERKYGEG